MAGAGYKLFTTGQVLTAAEVNTYLQEQTVMVFNDAASRTTALSSVLAEGMVSYLKSTKVVEIYNGTAWASLDDPNAIQNTIVDAKGDLISASGNDVPARLAVGANNTILVADSTQATGLKWAGSWTAFTPTWGATTVGNGTVTARYTQRGNVVHFWIRFVLGSTSTIGDTTISFPIAAASDNAGRSANILVQFEDNGVGPYTGMTIAVSGNSLGFRIGTINTNAAYANAGVLSTTAPFTWTTNDSIFVSGTYEV